MQKNTFYLLISLLVFISISQCSCSEYADLNTPTGLTASDNEFTGGVLVSWKSVSRASSYSVYRSNGISSDLEYYANTNNYTYFDSAATAGTAYYYAVKAVDGDNNKSGMSNTDTGSRQVSVTPETWTIMIYLDGDNDLEEYAVEDFKEMENGLNAAYNAGNTNIYDNLNVIVLFDRCIDRSEADIDGIWSYTRLYSLTEDSPDRTQRLSGSGHFAGDLSGDVELNMADPDTLSDFIDFCKTNYSAGNYALILWNHGGGARKKSIGSSVNSSVKAICWDEDSGGINNALYLDEIQQAVSANFTSVDKLDVIGFDACLMGMVEVAYEFRGLADYMIGSMYQEQIDGWDYERIFGNIKDHWDETLIAGSDLSYIIVEAYKNFIGEYPYDTGETLAATKLPDIETLKQKVYLLAQEIYNEESYAHSLNSESSLEGVRESTIHFYFSDYESILYPFYDLYDLCLNISNGPYSAELKDSALDVISALSDAILVAYGDDGNGQDYYFGTGNIVKRGLSIFFSRGNLSYSGNSHFYYQEWYTITDLSSPPDYGNIDFCDRSGNLVVDTWLELFEEWY